MDWAQNGREAVEIYRKGGGKHEMIFMDLQMPEMDGYEATRAIRRMGDSRALTIPIVAMTANVFREDISKCLAAGMNDHIGKPLNLTDVIGKLKKYLLGEK
jgi:CheY-like chemotaxis protein